MVTLDLGPDLWAGLLAWAWTCLVTVDLPGGHWAVSDLLTLNRSDLTPDLGTQPDLGPALSLQAVG